MKMLSKYLMAAFLPLMIAGCASDNDIAGTSPSSSPVPLSFAVSDQGYVNSDIKANTRTSESSTYTTAFTSGDKLGMYVVNGSGTVVKENICLTYDGSSWTPSELFYYDSSNMTGYKFFAYYPYSATTTTVDGSATDAKTFFASKISGWTPATNQATPAEYAANDLMVGAGTVGSISNGMFPVTFAMTHSMAMIVMKLPYVILTADASYGFTLGMTCSGFFPRHTTLGEYRYLVKPSTSTTIAGSYAQMEKLTANVKKTFSQSVTSGDANTYYTLTIDTYGDDGTKHTPAAGDYLLNDGGIVPKTATNTSILGCLSRAVGVVTSVSPSTADKSAGYTHGYVMALQNASTSAAWSNSTSYDEVLMNHTTQTYDTFIKYKDGRLNTDTIVSLGLAKQTYSATTYPAHYAAVNFSGAVAVPTGCSNWYLPSIGQMYDVAVNLCSQTEVPSNSLTGYCYWSGTSSAAATALSAYMTKVSSNGGTATGFTNSNEYYWTSSEYSSSLAYSLNFGSGGSLYLSRGSKDNTYYVRPFLAF
jgi:hypothetical protein